PSALACLQDDFEACIAHLRFPLAHRRAIRTTNMERRRTKVIPHAFDERAVLKLMYAALIRAAERWRGFRMTEFERPQLTPPRTPSGPNPPHREGAAPIKSENSPPPPTRLPSTSRTCPAGAVRITVTTAIPRARQPELRPRGTADQPHA